MLPAEALKLRRKCFALRNCSICEVYCLALTSSANSEAVSVAAFTASPASSAFNRWPNAAIDVRNPWLNCSTTPCDGADARTARDFRERQTNLLIRYQPPVPALPPGGSA